MKRGLLCIAAALVLAAGALWLTSLRNYDTADAVEENGVLLYLRKDHGAAFASTYRWDGIGDAIDYVIPDTVQGVKVTAIGGLTGGMMAVLALVNDLMVVFGTFVLLRTALDGNFIAAMLTILGYSINDTVVVYDRIRENRALMGKKASFEELVNRSVNQSARRTLITTITTVMALGVMCIIAKLYGLDSIFTFAFPLTMGMISGVYTSLCVSTSAWVLWSERKPKAKKN